MIVLALVHEYGVQVSSPKFAKECATMVKVLVLCIGTNNLWKDPVDVVVQKLMDAVRLLCTNYTQAHLLLLGVCGSCTCDGV